jgi:hypothetical protein
MLSVPALSFKLKFSGFQIWKFLLQELCEIWGSYGVEYEDGCVLGCCAVQSGRDLPKLQKDHLLPSSSGCTIPQDGHIHI